MSRIDGDGSCAASWVLGDVPRDREGSYLAYMSVPCPTSRVVCYTVHQSANGFFFGVIGSYFDFDVLDDEVYVVAWCWQPEGPNAIKGTGDR